MAEETPDQEGVDSDVEIVEPKEKDDEAKEDESSEKETEDKSNKYKDWPLRGIKEPQENDVLYGRGGGTNHHPGNKRYRKMVEDRKLDYVNSKRLDKPLVALDIIRKWRAQEPPGRFLKMDSTGLWSDVGDKKAREKTSQALREKAPLIRKQQEEEKNLNGDDGHDDDLEVATGKATRFAEGTTMESKGGVSKAILARDHSLGREYLQAGETVALDNFSWQDPFGSGRASSQGSLPNVPPPPSVAPPRPPPPPGTPGYRTSSHGMGQPPPSHGMGQPPPPSYYGNDTRVTSEERRSQFSSGQRYESWTQRPSTMSSFNEYSIEQTHSGSWGHAPPSVPHDMQMPKREHSLSHNPLQNASIGHPVAPSAFDSGPRDNSLAFNPLQNATVSHVAPTNAFDTRVASETGYWGDMGQQRTASKPPSSAPQPYGMHAQQFNGQSQFVGEYSQEREYKRADTSSSINSAQPYSLDPAVASAWSSGQQSHGNAFGNPFDGSRETSGGAFGGSMDRHAYSNLNRHDYLPRPHMVKRHTSNQNETLETRRDLVGPSVKRAALNRDNSLASNRLKAEHLPGFYNQNGKFDPEKEMLALSSNMEQSSLGGSLAPKPTSISTQERTTTAELMAMDLMIKPAPLAESSRSSTIEALALDNLEDDPVFHRPSIDKPPKPMGLSADNRTSTMEACMSDLEEISRRPLTLTASDRITTGDFLELVNEPIH